MAKQIVIGTRGSKLALWQAYYTRDRLEEAGYDVELKVIQTKGDRVQDLSFNKIEGKGFFTKEIEADLLNESIDLAVHSYKDLPTENVPGLFIAANSYRANPADVLLINEAAVDESQLFGLKEGARVGTSSARRKAQLLAFRPDLELIDVRGNVPTRIEKLKSSGSFDAIMLAAAGLERLSFLDLKDVIQRSLAPHFFIPAPAQGVLAFQIRNEDEEMHQVAAYELNDAQVAKAIQVERSILKALEGGCQQPIGVYAEVDLEGERRVWATQAADAESMPKRVFVRAENGKTASEAVLRLLADDSKQHIYITRDLEEDSFLNRYCKAHGHRLSGQSLIRFEGITYDTVPDCDWIFFSSPRAAMHFMVQLPELADNVRIAAMGAGTARKLRQYQAPVHFIGESGDTKAVAAAFAEVAKSGKVLFPKAQDSLRSIQKAMPSVLECMDMDVYRSIPIDELQVPVCDVMIFTSPRNVEVYFSKYKLKNERVIAIGPTTAEKLRSFGVENIVLPASPNEWSLAEVIKG